MEKDKIRNFRVVDLANLDQVEWLYIGVWHPGDDRRVGDRSSFDYSFNPGDLEHGWRWIRVSELSKLDKAYYNITEVIEPLQEGL